MRLSIDCAAKCSGTLKVTDYTRIFLLFALLPGAVQAMGISEALQLASQHDPVVAESNAQFDADQQLGSQVVGTLRPSVSASAGLGRNRNENESQFFGSFQETYDDYSAGISARQPVYRFDWSARKDQAEALDEQARTSLTSRQQSFALRIAERYFSVLVAEEELGLAQAEARAIRESLSDTQKRFDVGLVAGTDLKEARARSDLAEARIIAAEQQLATARDALQESTGRGDAKLPVLPAAAGLPALMPDNADAWVQQVRENNPDVQLAAQAVTVAEADAKRARADILPRVDAVASYGHVDTSDSLIGSERDEARLGLELEVPIYAGGINRARQRESEARARRARASHARIRAEVERLTRQRFMTLKSAYAQERALAVAVTSAEAAEVATRNGYDAGTRTITDVLNARSAVIAARRDYTSIRYNLLLDWMRLKALNAELGMDDFEQMDALLVSRAAPDKVEKSQVEASQLEGSKAEETTETGKTK